MISFSSCWKWWNSVSNISSQSPTLPVTKMYSPSSAVCRFAILCSVESQSRDVKWSGFRCSLQFPLYSYACRSSLRKAKRYLRERPSTPPFLREIRSQYHNILWRTFLTNGEDDLVGLILVSSAKSFESCCDVTESSFMDF